MIRVLHVLQGVDAGGAETYVMNLYREIDRNVIQFDFAIQKHGGLYEEEIKELGGNIYILPQFKFVNSLHFERELYRILIDNSDIKIVHSQNNSIGAYALRAAKYANTITVAHSHTNKSHICNWKDCIYQAFAPYTRYLFRKYADYRFACSMGAGIWQYGKNAIFDIKENSIRLDRFRYDMASRNSFRDAYNIKNKYVLGHVGRFEMVKNHLYLFDIFAAFHRDVSDSVLLLVGEGRQKERIIRAAKDKGIYDSIIVLDNQKNVEKVYQAMDVFIMPSLYEGFPMTLVEAQASGLPCIVSDRGSYDVDLTDLIVHLPLERSVKRWCKAIKDAIKKPRSTMQDGAILEYNSIQNAVSMQRFYVDVVNELMR